MTPLDALYRCQRAWEATQPQLFWTNEVLWPDNGLDDGQELTRLPIVEPAASPPIPPGGGLTLGAEPCCGTPSELTAQSLHSPARVGSGGSAPSTTTTPRAAQPGQVKRGTGQEVTV